MMCNHKKVKYSSLAIGIILLSVLMCNSYGLANRLDLTDINNQWRFSYFGSSTGAGTEAVGFNDSSWNAVDLPHTWNALDTQDGVNNNYARGFGWYRKHYTIGSEYSGKRVFLFFEAVGRKADVYCNGTHVGNHLGAYGAFCYDITDQVNFGGDNVIAVRADNANTSSVSSLNIIPQSGDFNQYGGICRKIHLIITEPVHITLMDYASPGVYLTPTNVSASSADLEVKVLVRNTEASTQSVTVRAKIYNASDVLVDTLQTTQSVSAGATQDVIQNTTVSNPHLWNGRVDPYLYKVVTELEVGGVVVDTVEQPLGFRYFSVDVNNGFFLNGQYLDLHGVAMHEDRINKGRAISDADREQDNALMLEMGCTWIRPSHYQHAEKFYDLCDESGLIISTEIPIVNSIDTSSTPFADNCKDQLKELIRQNYNHPSICFWLLYNELTTSGSDTLIGQLNDLAHAEDPTRPTTCAHNNTSDTASFSYITDTLAYNRYMGWYGGTPEGFAPWADGIHTTRSTDEIGITEYGAGANPFQHQVPPEYPGPSAPFHPEEYQSYYHEVYWKAMKARPWLWCKTIWNGFDFAVDGRNEGSQIELNDKGMVTRDRSIKKDTFYWYKANWTTEPMVYITSRRNTPMDAPPLYIKVYSNCDTVELFINGVSQGTKTGADCIFQWDGVTLTSCYNAIEVVGHSGGTQCNDSCVWESPISADFSGPAGVPDCVVNYIDFAEIASQWQEIYGTLISPSDPGTADLVAYYSLDNTYNDISGNGHNATPIGSPQFIDPGHTGQSVDLDSSSSSYLNCANSTNINLTSGGTISVWIKSDGTNCDQWASIVTKGINAWRLIREDWGDTVDFHFNKDTSLGDEYKANGTTPVLDNEWHHLMGVYDSTNSEVRLYVDGQLDGSGATGTINTSTDPVYIGSRYGSVGARDWDGQIDEVRIYDRALNTEEQLWLSEGDPYILISGDPRPTDLFQDGQINIDDLLVFFESWMHGI